MTDGNITVNQGTLSIETTSTVQGNGTITMGAGTTLQFYDNTTQGNVTRNMVFNGITVDNQNRASEIIDSNVAFGGDNTFSVGTSSTNTLTWNGSFSESGGPRALNKTGAGVLVLNSANTYSGDTKVSGGSLRLGNSLALQNSTLDYNNYGGSLSFGGLTNATFGGLKGSQSLALTNTASAAVALTVGGNNSTTIYSAALSGGGSLTKTGTGSLTLGGSNTFTGPTTVSNGTLALSTAGTNNIANSPSITVSSSGTFSVTGVTGSGGFKLAGTQTLTNNGSVTGNITIPNGTTALGTGSYSGTVSMQSGGTFIPGTTGTIASVNAGGFAASGGTLQIDISGASSDQIHVTNAATFTGGAITLSMLAVPTVASFDVLSAGSLTGAPTLSTTNIGGTQFSIDSAALASNIVRIDVISSQFIWSNKSPATGDGVTWDVSGNQNWSNAGTPAVYTNGQAVNFTDANNGHYSVTVVAGVSLAGATVANNVGDYVFSGAPIGGAGSIIKTGTRALTLSGSNSYSGGTTVSQGAVNVNAAGGLGSGRGKCRRWNIES